MCFSCQLLNHRASPREFDAPATAIARFSASPACSAQSRYNPAQAIQDATDGNDGSLCSTPQP